MRIEDDVGAAQDSALRIGAEAPKTGLLGPLASHGTSRLLECSQATSSHARPPKRTEGQGRESVTEPKKGLDEQRDFRSFRARVTTKLEHVFLFDDDLIRVLRWP